MHCFTIALYDAQADLLTFPYFVDESGGPPPVPRKPGKRLVERVLRWARRSSSTSRRATRLVAAGQLEPAPSIVRDWMGAPLKHGDQTFGVISVCELPAGNPLRPGGAGPAAPSSHTRWRRRSTGARRRTRSRESEARFRTLTDTAPCAIFMYQGARVVYANAFTEELTGYSRGAARPATSGTPSTPTSATSSASAGFARQDRAAPPGTYEFKIVRKDGSERWVQFGASSIDLGGKAAALGTAFDITERKPAGRADRAPRLPRRADRPAEPAALQRPPRQAIAQAHRQRHRVGGALPRPRPLQGDQRLARPRPRRRAPAGTSRAPAGAACARATRWRAWAATSSRSLLPGVQRRRGRRRAWPTSSSRRCAQPFDARGPRAVRHAPASASAATPRTATDAETLLKNADIAMYRAKEQGARQLPALRARPWTRRAWSGCRLENDLRRALAHDELVLYYQPMLDSRTGRVARRRGAAALAAPGARPAGRRPSSSGWPRSPGSSCPIGLWVLRTACRRSRAWQRRGHAARPGRGQPLRRASSSSPTCSSRVQGVLAETGLPAALLELEITETLAMQNAEATIAVLRGLKELGVRDRHRRLRHRLLVAQPTSAPSHRHLKIDQSFVPATCTTDPDDAAIARAVIAMAHSLELNVVAEGVETEEQLAFLRERAATACRDTCSPFPCPRPSASRSSIAGRRTSGR